MCLAFACTDAGELTNPAEEPIADDLKADRVAGMGSDVSSLDAERSRLFELNPELGSGDGMCERWSSLDRSQRAVFLLLTDRLYLSDTPDSDNMLLHTERIEAILGGGESGQDCGSSDNNRLFIRVDGYAWQLLVDTWNRSNSIGDGGGGKWQRTLDLAGPHAPFDASTETEAGTRCLALLEVTGSRPPTLQAHFFRPDTQQPIERGTVLLDSDQHTVEIDHDFDCWHRSNPLCPGKTFDLDYADSYGDFDCHWVPRGCQPAHSQCYPAAQ